jgi:hypothetical protein
MVTISGVRAIINIPQAQELSDDAIQEAIDRAGTFIGFLAARSTASPETVDLAETNYAAYLAYLSYSDRVLNQLPGSTDSEGIWSPTGEVINREVNSKLALLKSTSDASIRQLIAFGPMGRLIRPSWLLY